MLHEFDQRLLKDLTEGPKRGGWFCRSKHYDRQLRNGRIFTRPRSNFVRRNFCLNYKVRLLIRLSPVWPDAKIKVAQIPPSNIAQEVDKVVLYKLQYFKIAQQNHQTFWDNFVRKFVTKTFQKCSNLVPLLLTKTKFV